MGHDRSLTRPPVPDALPDLWPGCPANRPLRVARALAVLAMPWPAFLVADRIGTAASCLGTLDCNRRDVLLYQVGLAVAAAGAAAAGLAAHLALHVRDRAVSFRAALACLAAFGVGLVAAFIALDDYSVAVNQATYSSTGWDLNLPTWTDIGNAAVVILFIVPVLIGLAATARALFKLRRTAG